MKPDILLPNIAEIGASVRAIVTGGAHGGRHRAARRRAGAEIIAINGSGTDAVDLDHARARATRVTTTLDVLTEDVADLALGLMVATARRICVADRFVRAGQWPSAHLPLAVRMNGKPWPRARTFSWLRRAAVRRPRGSSTGRCLTRSARAAF